MLGVEVFRDKQGQGQGRREGGEKEGKEEEKEGQMEGVKEQGEKCDTENGNQDGSPKPKANGGNQETST